MSKLTVGYVHPLTPFRNELRGMLNTDFDHFFSEFFDFGRGKKMSSRSYPKMDVYEDEGNLIIEAAVPGLKKSEVRVSLENNILTISGEKRGKYGNDLLRELKRSTFSRSFELASHYPEPMAEMKDGVLTLIFKDVIQDKKLSKKQIVIQ